MPLPFVMNDQDAMELGKYYVGIVFLVRLAKNILISLLIALYNCILFPHPNALGQIVVFSVTLNHTFF